LDVGQLFAAVFEVDVLDGDRLASRTVNGFEHLSEAPAWNGQQQCSSLENFTTYCPAPP
jgi:hypothetical protein